MKVSKSECFQSLPPDYPHGLLPDIQRLVKESRRKIVVLDDDPTGTQTVRNITVLTGWDVASLRQVLSEDVVFCLPRWKP